MRLLAGSGHYRSPDAKYRLVDERDIFMVRQHPARVLPSLTEAVGGLLVALAVGSISEGARPVHVLIWILAAFLVVRSFWEIANWVVQYIVLTDQRLILTSGLVSRKVMAFPLNRLLDMSFSRSTAGSLLGYGTFALESDGGKAKAAIDYIPYPDQLYLEVTNLLYPGSPTLPEKNEIADEDPPTLDDLPVVGGDAARFGDSPETGPGSAGRPEEPPGVAPDGSVGQPADPPEAAPDGDAGQPGS